MIVRIAVANLVVAEADDCARLQVEAPGLDDGAAGAALAMHGMGRVGAPGHLWLHVQALRRAAPATVDATDWENRFEAMLGYAVERGWLDESGEYVAAHIERG